MRNVIIGASLAGLRAAEAMRAAGFDGEIHLIGAEDRLPYARPPLSKEFLKGEVNENDLLLRPEAFFHEQRIELHLGTRASELDVERKVVRFESSRELGFDRLLVATGAEPRHLILGDSLLDGICVMRTVADARDLAHRLRRATNVVIVGGGLIGLEVASAARGAGKSVVVLESNPQPLARVLGPRLGDAMAQLHRGHGVDVRTNVSVLNVCGVGRVEDVLLTDGARIPADLVVIAIGVRPSIAWLRGSGVDVRDGVLVDEYARTNVPTIFAAGDVARLWDVRGRSHVRLESYAHAEAHGRAAGASMVGAGMAFSPAWGGSSEFFGKRLQILGHVAGDEVVVARGRFEDGRASALLLRGARVTAAVVLDRGRDALAARELIASGREVDVNRLRDEAVPLDSAVKV